MATRCMVMLEKNQTCYDAGNPNNGVRYAAFYRHYDGYPTSTGLDLVMKVSEILPGSGFDTVWDAERALKRVLPLSDYETEWHENLHGDIEYMYLVNFDDGCTITVYSRRHAENSDVDGWRSWPAHVLARWEQSTRTNGYLVLEEITIRRSMEA